LVAVLFSAGPWRIIELVAKPLGSTSELIYLLPGTMGLRLASTQLIQVLFGS
jgi:hypothetical protein